jgi:hypothetical protein
MTAAEIAAELGAACREGSTWRCRCPLHGGRSLVLRDGNNGRLLVTCRGGCDRLGVLAELRRRGLLSYRPDYQPRFVSSPHRRDEASRTSCLNIWRNTQHGADTIVVRYLASRSITRSMAVIAALSCSLSAAKGRHGQFAYAAASNGGAS